MNSQLRKHLESQGAKESDLEAIDVMLHTEPKKPYVKPDKLPDLPNSDSEFFEGADRQIIVLEPTPAPQKHVMDWDGPYAVCTSCAFTHTIPIDPKKHTIRDGAIVPC